MSEFNDMALVNAVHAAVKVELPLSERFIDRWMGEVYNRLGRLQPVGLCSVVHAVAKLGGAVRRDGRFWERWFQVTVPKLGQVSDQGLSVMMYSLGHISQQPTAEFVAGWYAAIKGRLQAQALSCQGLSNSIYALGKLDIVPDDDFLELWDRAARWKAAEFTNQHFSNIILAFSLLGVKPTKRFMLVWFEYADPHEFTAQGLANSVAALAKLGFTSLPDDFNRKWIDAAVAAMPKFSPQELCSTIYAVAQFETAPETSLVDAWCARATDLMPAFSTRELSVSIHSFGRMSVVPCDRFLERWRAAALEVEFPCSQAASVLVALARLALPWSKGVSDHIKTNAADDATSGIHETYVAVASR